MMTRLLTIKEYLKNIYGTYTSYVEPALKFCAAVLCMIVINMNVGYMSILKNPAIVVIIGLVCAFMPINIILAIMMAFLVAHIYALETLLAVIFAAILLIMYILYFRFAPSDAYALILMPVLFCIKIPYLFPIIMGLVATPISIISVYFATIMYFMIYYIGQNAAAITNASADSEMQKVVSVLTEMFGSKEMYLILFTFAITLVVVYVIKRRSMDYAWSIAIVTGGIVNMVVILLGVIFMEIDTIVPIWGIVVGILVSMGIAYIVQYFILSVDYTRTEYVQFEDEDYYYYVKAVPKVNMVSADVKVTRINTRKADVKNVRRNSR